VKLVVGTSQVTAGPVSILGKPPQTIEKLDGTVLSVLGGPTQNHEAGRLEVGRRRAGCLQRCRPTLEREGTEHIDFRGVVDLDRMQELTARTASSATSFSTAGSNRKRSVRTTRRLDPGRRSSWPSTWSGRFRRTRITGSASVSGATAVW
jgi:hypothetical protein